MSNYDRSYLIATAVDYQNAVAAERYFASLQEDDEPCDPYILKKDVQDLYDYGKSRFYRLVSFDTNTTVYEEECVAFIVFKEKNSDRTFLAKLIEGKKEGNYEPLDMVEEGYCDREGKWVCEYEWRLYA